MIFPARVEFHRHPQGLAERLENRLGLVVRVIASQIVHMHGYQRVIDKSLKKFVHQIDIEFADSRPRELDREDQPRASGNVEHDARQRFIERNISMTVAAYAFLVGDGARESLAKSNADVLDRMVRIDAQVPFGVDFKAKLPVTRDLLEHVIKEGHAGGDVGFDLAIKVERRRYPRFVGIANDLRLTM